MRMVYASIVVAACAILIVGCNLTPNVTDISHNAKNFGSIEKGQRYRFRIDALTSDRAIVTSFSSRVSSYERKMIDVDTYKRNSATYPSHSIFPRGTVIEIQSIEVVDNVTWAYPKATVIVVSGKRKGNKFDLMYDLMDGSFESQTLQLDPRWLERI